MAIIREPNAADPTIQSIAIMLKLFIILLQEFMYENSHANVITSANCKRKVTHPCDIRRLR